MANIKKWLKDAESQIGEEIKKIAVGKHYGEHYDDPDPKIWQNQLLSREEGFTYLDYNFDSGFGGADCHPIYAWTKSWIFIIHEYDGATGLRYLPRNPIPCKPDFGGNHFDY